ncbi:MAG: hypothetical protein NZ826_02180 [Thermodesulfovibrio sp.]|nr:hypothetical protein [Thermodesulfovibrio sp.]MDW7972795.1 hypothetical protein [Thermodesulfovibrio sp.]
MINKQLFYQNGELRNLLERRKLEIEREVDQYETNYILNISEYDFQQYLINKYSLHTPKIHRDKIYISNVEEIYIDISRDHVRSFNYMTHYVKGVGVTIVIPFEGDSELFHFRPSTYTIDPPRGKVLDNEIILKYETVETDEEKFKQTYERDIHQPQDVNRELILTVVAFKI